MNNKNPIFIEYYSHTQCFCFKIKNPFTVYGSETIVLCTVDEGVEKAKELALKEITKNLTDALTKNIYQID